MFLDHSYVKRHLKTDSAFYKEALLAISTLQTSKGIPNVHYWDTEHLFYNKYFTVRDTEKTFTITKHFEYKGILTLGNFLEEKVKEIRSQPYDQIAVSLYKNITVSPYATKEDTILINNKQLKFDEITHKTLYEAFTYNITGFHHSQIKWFYKMDDPISWDDVWNSVHNFLCTNETVSAIWHQLHLNFYTQYSYNKWHKVDMMCPLCEKKTESIFHLILHCDVVIKLWNDINK